MEIVFETTWLKKRCESEREAVREWGAAVAKKLMQRLAELSAAENLGDISPHRPARLHELKHDRQGQLAVDLHGGYRLIFVPNHEPKPVKEDGGLDRERVTSIRVVEVGDYHDS